MNRKSIKHTLTRENYMVTISQETSSNLSISGRNEIIVGEENRQLPRKQNGTEIQNDRKDFIDLWLCDREKERGVIGMTFRNAAKRIIASIRHCHRTKTSYDVQVSANKIRWNKIRFFIPMWKVQVQQEEILILNMYRFKLRGQPQKNSRTKHTLVNDQLNILRQYLGK